MQNSDLHSSFAIILFRIIFYICAVYFLMMAVGLIFFPHILLRSTVGNNVNPTVLGILRGAGGSILPYSVLYYVTARSPFRFQWAFYIIALASIIAIILDFTSVFLGEYKIIHAMYDIPFEVLSLVGIILFWTKVHLMKKKKKVYSN